LPRRPVASSATPFDDSDWAAVSAGLPGTNSEHGPWFAYPIGDVQILVAHEPGADEMVSIWLDDLPDRADIALLADIMRDYQVKER